MPTLPFRQAVPSSAPAAAGGPAAGLSGTNLERAGDYNQRIVLQAIRIHGPVTRTELATMSGLTPPAIANITRRLLAEGLILDAGQRRGGRGQPATRLAINPDGCLSLGINVDRDHITVLLLDLAGAVRARASREQPLAAPHAVAEIAAQMGAALLAELGADAPRVLGAGLAIPDDLDRVTLPAIHNQDGWGCVDVKALFSAALDMPVQLENDAAAAAIGELHFGLGLSISSFFYVLITTGLGGGLVVEGEYFRGANGRSGEIGFLPLHGPDSEARTLQECVSLSALYAHLADHGVSVGGPATLSSLPAAAAQVLDTWLDSAAQILTEPLMAVSWLINPQAILLGGRLPAEQIEDLASRLTAKLGAKGRTPAPIPVLKAAAAEDAPAIGAAILPMLQAILPSRSTLMKTAEA